MLVYSIKMQLSELFRKKQLHSLFLFYYFLFLQISIRICFITFIKMKR